MNSNFPISQSSIEKFLDNQSKEMEIRATELSIRKAEIDHNQLYSLKVLEAQKEDRVGVRATHSSLIKWKIISFLICFSILLFFCGFAIYLKQTEIIVELIKILVPSIATGIGFYFVGKNKGYALAQNDADDE